MNATDNIQMVDLRGQYSRLQSEIDRRVLEVLRSTAFINGPEVKTFAADLGAYLGAQHVIPCANGTDALQIAMMAAGLQPGDEVIVPAFTYVATAEVIALLRLTPVMIDVEPDTFNINADLVRAALTERTRAIVPVHLFGQSTDMEPILELAREHDLIVIEDNAQAIGATYRFEDGRTARTGTMGHIGCTSFYPSKNLGAYGDGGAIFTNDEALAQQIRSIANHGQSSRRYYHDSIGVNSRLDSMQAAVLNVKLAYLDEFNATRRAAADRYDALLTDIDALVLPKRDPKSTHVFHQYTLRVTNGQRDELKEFLGERGIPSMIYYPVPLYKQEAYQQYWDGQELPITEMLSEQVISLPMHSELSAEACDRIGSAIREFFAA